MQVFYSRASTPGTYATSLNGWIVDFPDPYSWVKALFTRGTAVTGGSNLSFWWDPRLETMIAEAQGTRDPASRLAKFAEMQTLISDQAPVVPIDSWYWATLNGPHVGGYYLHPIYICDAAHYWHQ